MPISRSTRGRGKWMVLLAPIGWGCAEAGNPVDIQPGRDRQLVGYKNGSFTIPTQGMVAGATISNDVASPFIMEDEIRVICWEVGTATITYWYPSGTIITQGIQCLPPHNQGGA